jgi:hypothetical protein
VIRVELEGRTERKERKDQVRKRGRLMRGVGFMSNFVVLHKT